MPADEYGMYSTYLSWYSIIAIICTLNMHSCVYLNTIAKRKSEEENDKDAISMLSLSGCLTLLIFAIYIIFQDFFNKIIGLPTALVSLIFAQVLFEPSVNFWSTKQRFKYRYIKLVIRTITMVICNAVLGILFVLIANKNEAIARVLSIVLVQMIFGVALYTYYVKRAKKIFHINNWKHYLEVQLPLLPHSLSLTILSSSDRIMINNLAGKTETALYSVAYSAGYVVNVLKNSIVDALRPWMYKKIKEKDFTSIRKNVNTVMILITLISIVFTAFAPEIVRIMAPEQYYSAIYTIPPIAAGSFFTFLYNIFSILGFYYEQTKKIMVASVSGAVINIVLNFVFIPIFGFVSAAYTTLVSYFFLSAAHYYIMRLICKKKLDNAQIYDMRFIGIMSVIVLAFASVFTITYSSIIIRYGIIILVIAVITIKRNIFISVLKDLKKDKN